MKIGFKNLRSLVNTGDLTIKPLTILLGQNSSGKSTFIRTFPLLKQSLETRTTGPILWYGRFVDFGDFSNALNDNTNDDFIEYAFDIEFLKDVKSRYIYRRRNPFISQTEKFTNCRVSIRLKGDKENRTYTSQMELLFNGFNIKIIIGKNHVLDKIIVDDHPLILEDVSVVSLGNSFLPHVIFKHEDGHYTLSSDRFLVRKIFERIRSISKKKFTDGTISKIIGKLDFSASDRLFNSIVEQDVVKGFSKKVETWTENDSNYKDLKALLLASTIPYLIERCDRYIAGIAQNTSYIAPLRATAERYYRPQDLNVDEVDFQGKNLALVLRNLSISEKSEFEKWCLRTFKFYPRAKVSGGNMTVNVKFEKDKSEHNIADLGFGFSQILPIITQIWTGVIKGRNPRSRDDFSPKIYAIEQPELHLHPKIQAMLVDAIIDVINFCSENDLLVYFILETHSETIVNTIGTRIYKEKLSEEDVNVIMFDRKISESISEVREVHYLKNGTLENWPYGFFEEDWNLKD